MADGNPKLAEFIGLVEHFNLELVRRYVGAGVEWMGYPEDLGMQKGPMLSPSHFRTYLEPDSVSAGTVGYSMPSCSR